MYLDESVQQEEYVHKGDDVEANVEKSVRQNHHFGVSQ